MQVEVIGRGLVMHEKWLDDVIAQCVSIGPPGYRFTELFLDAGADPLRAYHDTGISPVNVLVDSSRSWLHDGVISDLEWFWHHPKVTGYFKQQKSTMLTGAIQTRRVDLALPFIELGITVRPWSIYTPPLKAALVLGNNLVLEALLKAGAHPLDRCSDRRTAVGFALKVGPPFSTSTSGMDGEE